jgi:hypothetical protein
MRSCCRCCPPVRQPLHKYHLPFAAVVRSNMMILLAAYGACSADGYMVCMLEFSRGGSPKCVTPQIAHIAIAVKSLLVKPFHFARCAVIACQLWHDCTALAPSIGRSGDKAGCQDWEFYLQKTTMVCYLAINLDMQTDKLFALPQLKEEQQERLVQSWR